MHDGDGRKMLAGDLATVHAKVDAGAVLDPLAIVDGVVFIRAAGRHAIGVSVDPVD